jgi:hypothetical protein
MDFTNDPINSHQVEKRLSLDLLLVLDGDLPITSTPRIRSQELKWLSASSPTRLFPLSRLWKQSKLTDPDLSRALSHCWMSVSSKSTRLYLPDEIII